jgi:hypothetical protein
MIDICIATLQTAPRPRQVNDKNNDLSWGNSFKLYITAIIKSQNIRLKSLKDFWEFKVGTWKLFLSKLGHKKKDNLNLKQKFPHLCTCWPIKKKCEIHVLILKYCLFIMKIYICIFSNNMTFSLVESHDFELCRIILKPYDLNYSRLCYYHCRK